MVNYATEIVPVAFDVFSIVAMVLQIPVILTYLCGPHPNIPVSAIAGWFFYFNLRNVIAMIAWSGSNYEEWWQGKVWCDFDVRMNAGSQLGIFSALILSLTHLIRIFSLKTQVISNRITWQRIVLEVAVCYTGPLILFAIYTPISTSRYLVNQYIGCSAATDSSVVNIIFFVLWPALFGTIVPIMLGYLLWKVYRRGRSGTCEAISFVPTMSATQFVRLTVMTSIICFVLTPLSWCVAGVNLNVIADVGVSAVAWAHGKPKDWDEPTLLPFALSMTPRFSYLNSAASISWAVEVSQLVLSYFVFAFYGTGTVAQQFYCKVLNALHLTGFAIKIRLLPPPYERKDDYAESDYWSSSSPSGSTFTASMYDKDTKRPKGMYTRSKPLEYSP